MTEETAESDRTTRQRLRFDGWDIAFVVAMLATFLVLTWLGRSMDFWHDDWRIISRYPGWSVEALMEPFNGHWVLTANAVWMLLFSTVGLSDYTPYLVFLHLAHVMTAAAVFWGVRRMAGPAAGILAGTIVLLHSGAAEMIFQAHAVDAVAATAFGAWALMFTLAGGRTRLIGAAILLVVSLASQSTGLPFVAAIAVYLLFVPGRWRELWVVVPALLTYAAWYLTWGQQADGSTRIVLHIGWARAFLEYVRDGVAFAMGEVSGLRTEVGLVLITILATATLWHLLGRGRFLYPALAGLAGLFAMYGLTALAGLDSAARIPEAPRYAYPAGLFILVAVAAWYGSRPRTRPVNALPLLVFVAWALIMNLFTMRWWIEEWYPPRQQETRAALTVLLEDGGTPQLPGALRTTPSSDPFLRALPGPDLLRLRIEQLGSPLDPSDRLGTERLPVEVYERVRADILESAATADAGDSGVGPGE